MCSPEENNCINYYVLPQFIPLTCKFHHNLNTCRDINALQFRFDFQDAKINNIGCTGLSTLYLKQVSSEGEIFLIPINTEKF